MTLETVGTMFIGALAFSVVIFLVIIAACEVKIWYRDKSR